MERSSKHRVTITLAAVAAVVMMWLTLHLRWQTGLYGKWRSDSFENDVIFYPDGTAQLRTLSGMLAATGTFRYEKPAIVRIHFEHNYDEWGRQYDYPNGNAGTQTGGDFIWRISISPDGKIMSYQEKKDGPSILKYALWNRPFKRKRHLF